MTLRSWKSFVLQSALAASSAPLAAAAWFPKWDGTHTCTETAYGIFLTHDGYGAVDQATCCSTYYTGDALATCNGSGPALPTGWVDLDNDGVADDAYYGTFEWYVHWTDGRCAKDCGSNTGDPACGGILSTSTTQTKYATAASCCDAHFSSQADEWCLFRAQGHEDSFDGTKQWYADQSENICVNDCDGAKPCGGIVKTAPYPTLYATIDACCSGALPTLDSDWCQGLVTEPRTATNKWFVAGSLCKKDCTGTGDECKPATQGDELFADAAACCTAKLKWAAPEYCESRSDPNNPIDGSGEAGFTDMWYVKYSANRCVKDCGDAANPQCEDVGTDGLSEKFYDDAASCCSKMLGWLDEDSCAVLSETGIAAESTGTGKFYASYKDKRCVRDCVYDSGAATTDISTTPQPALPWNLPECGGVLKETAGVTLYDSSSACCDAKFGWYADGLCEVLSDSAGDGHTGKWFVKYEDNACVNDCAVASADPECAGQPSDHSNALYDSASACCQGKLGWLDSDSCVSKSENGVEAAATGTDKWYVDYSDKVCKKDCATGGIDTDCSGIIDSNKGQQLYDSHISCCDAKLGWIKKELCEAMSLLSGADYPHSNLFYPDQMEGLCHQDCAVVNGAPCNGSPEDLSSPMYDSVSACCSGSVGWVQADKCAQTDPSTLGTNEWWIDWNKKKCVKNCVEDAATPECGGLAESWNELHSSAGSCCSQPTFSQIEYANCKQG